MTVELNIQLQRGGFLLDVYLSAPAGVTVIFGPSGSGKTTLLRAVAGLQPIDSGYISISKENIVGLAPHKRAVGYVFQEPRLFPHITVFQNLKFAEKMGRVGVVQDVDEVIDLLDLRGLLTRYSGALSGGESQRVALGRALLSAPKCLCLDEPLSALDHALKQRILPYLERLCNKTKIPILYVTHDAAEMARLADHIVLMRAGRSVLSGSAAKILTDPTAVPFLGVRTAGTVISGWIMPPDPTTGLAVMRFAGGHLILPELSQSVGRAVRVRIAAQDIILATEMPKGLSALNVLKGILTDMHRGQGPGVMVQFKVGETLFLARITQYSAGKMGLAKGQTVFAIVKASTFDPAGIGT